MKHRTDDIEYAKDETCSPPKSNTTLERESKGCASVLFYMVIFLTLDVWKQVTSYGMKYYNNNRYPVPQTQVVAFTEFAKFCIFFAVLIYNKQLTMVKISWWYAVPSILYTINNNIYYFALNYVTPPVWNIIIQLRVLFTALTYRLFFKREVTPLQWGALSLLIVAIVMTIMTGGNNLTGANNFQIAICLAVFGSITSVFGTIVMEYLFKNDQRPFAEMQMQMYMFSSAMAWVFYMVEAFTTKEHEIYENANQTLVMLMVVGCVALSCTTGISVAFIVKKLDNIVKLYSQAISNMLTSIACTLLFPDHFHLNFLFVLCLLLMFAAIMLYENKNWTFEDLRNYVVQKRSWVTGVVVFVLIVTVVWLLTGSSDQVRNMFKRSLSSIST